MNTPTQISRAGFVLAGGKSSRIGTNKAFLNFRGETLLNHAFTTLRAVCGNVTIVGERQTFASFGPTVEDRILECGPLGGIHAALSHSAAELNVMLAVDMPFVSIELLDFLLTIAAETDAIVTVPRTKGGLQPLCAVYRPDFFYTAETNLRAGQYKIDMVFASVSVRIVEEAVLAAAGFSEQNFFNVNTPEDHRTAEGRHLQP